VKTVSGKVVSHLLA